MNPTLKKTVFLLYALIWTFGLSGQDSKNFIRKNFGRLHQSAIMDSLIRSSERLAEENPDTALFLAQTALELAIASDNNEKLSLAARCAAEAWFYKNDYQKAIGFYLQSADASYKFNNDSNSFMAERLTDAAYCYQELGITEKALSLNKASLNIQKKLQNAVEISNNLNNIGTNYFYLSQFDKAIEYFGQTLYLDRKSGDSAAIATSLNNMGMVYSRWGKHRQAIGFYEDALGYTPAGPSKAIRLSNIGMAWYYLKDYNTALEYLYKALRIDQKYNQKIKVGIRKNEISTVLAAKGKYNEAIRLNEEALIIFRETGIKESQIITLTDMGNIYRQLGQTNKAERCFLESSAIANENHSLFNLARNYKSLYELAEENNDYKKAYEYFKKFSSINDSVFSAEKHKQLANFEILYETEKKEKENQLLLLDIELKQRKQRLGIAIIIGLALILLLTYNFLRIKSKNLKQSQRLLKQEQDLARLRIKSKEAENKMLEDRIFAEQQINRLEREKYLAELEYKNIQLANSTINLVNKNEILGEIRDKLKTNHKTDIIHEVVQFINANTDIDQDWHKFKATFEEVHAGFFDRIQAGFPQLTDHDIRLSAYLRINLSSREIAGLMNVSLDATNKGRQRLRKKLNLEAEADLNGFLISL
ncbi:MAG: tetratricopeptide repeat protein [Bacteroidales bacterium]|nr:tetratricopeptide repeat protein [Bacteroidales bacterium]